MMNLIEIKETVQKELKTLIKSRYNRNINVKVSDRFVEDLGFDSLDRVEAWTALEQKYKIDISEKKIINVKTVMEIVEIIQKCLKEKDGNST